MAKSCIRLPIHSEARRFHKLTTYEFSGHSHFVLFCRLDAFPVANQQRQSKEVIELPKERVKTYQEI